MGNSSKIKRNHSPKIIPLFTKDSPQAQKTLKREILQKLSQCSSKCLNDVVTTSFEDLTLRVERYENLENSGEIVSIGDNLIEGVNRTTGGMLTPSNLVVLGNREVAIGHALEIISELPKHKLAGALFSLREEPKHLGQILLGMTADISLFRIEKGAIADTMWPALTRNAGNLCDSKLFINGRKDILIEEIIDEVIRLKGIYGRLDCVIIDNLEDLKSNSKDKYNFIKLLEELHILANEQESLILVLSQQDLKENIIKNREEKPIEQQSELEKGIRLHADFVYNLSEVKSHQGTVDFSYCNLRDGVQDGFEYFSKNIINYAAFKGLIGKEI